MQTLNSFFETQKDSPAWVNSIEGSAEFSQAKQAIAQELTGFQVSQSFFELMIMKLCEALDIEVGKLLIQGWRKHQEIIQYRDKPNPPSGFHEVTLLEHTLVSKHSPTLQPVINQVPLKKLKFDIIVKLKLDGGKLFIQDGMISKATTGSCTGSGSLEYKGYKILEKNTAKYDLPGSLEFDPGISL